MSEASRRIDQEAGTCRRSVQQSREKGNRAFGKGDYVASYRFYSVGLQLCSDETGMSCPFLFLTTFLRKTSIEFHGCSERDLCPSPPLSATLAL